MARSTIRSTIHQALTAGVALATVAGIAACTPSANSATGYDVVTAFYPLQYVTERIGGEHISVRSLVPPGADSHSVELSPNTVASLGEADLVVYLSGFQAATDAAVQSTKPAQVVDAADTANLVSGPDGVEPGRGSGALDPHFWLDPTRLSAVGYQVAEALTKIDPNNAETFTARANSLAADLEALDIELADGLSHCQGATLVASHEAFGYLTQRYGLHQVGLSGIDPEVEPSPARLRAVAATVREQGVQTLFFEVLTSPKVTQTLADELGVATAVLDPLEVRAENDERNYLDIMRANLAALTSGLTCSG